MPVNDLGLMLRTVASREQHLRAILSDYIGHYHTGRSHKGDGMSLRAPDDDPDIIASRSRPPRSSAEPDSRGLINEYRPAA